MRQLSDGRWTANHRAVGPGYASAYGLVALLHHRPATPEGGPPWIDVNVRTHGSGSYRSILRGSSHGCHRLFNHLAIRLGSFLVAHGGALRLGQSTERYEHSVRWRGKVYRLRAASRGYRFELSPPIEVHVRPGPAISAGRTSPPVAELWDAERPEPVDIDECGRVALAEPPRSVETERATTQARSLLLSPPARPVE